MIVFVLCCIVLGILIRKSEDMQNYENNIENIDISEFENKNRKTVKQPFLNGLPPWIQA